ncbi:MAG: CoA transferase [Actinobacteria bacterium]|uniref:Unannotated protein n=1 Tax=freshwater metagenome TaxID=449393 RepID=A0A6J7S6H1_9ZZZZ|nr:CoA transferase [Actinomycetota bacterium]
MTSNPSISASQWAGELLEFIGADHQLSVEVPESAPIADWARSGAVSITGTPIQLLTPPGFAATAARGALLAIDTLAGATGIPGELLLAERAALSKWPAKAPWTLGLHSRAVRTRDGWFALSLAREIDQDSVPALIGAPTSHGWVSVDAWARTITTQEAVDRCRLFGIPAGQIASVTGAELMQLTSYGASLPRSLTGLRVVDLSALWAGPLCANLLQQAGAEVIRVESAQRPDGSRVGIPAFDDLLHAGQKSVTFDPANLDFLHALIDSADIVITASRPRGLTSLELDPQAWLASRAHGVWVQISAYGSTGPEANWIGFGDDTAMAAGLVRWIDGIPIPIADAIADPLTGMHAAVAAIALAQRGGAHLIDISLANVAAATAGDAPASDPFLADGQWQIETEYGIRPIEKPRARTVLGTARTLGADNQIMRAELAR